MDYLLIFISLTLFTFTGYVLWPSRYNIINHSLVAGSFISIFVPTLILNISKNYSQPIVDLYVKILLVGMLFYLPGNILGFILGRRLSTSFSFDVMAANVYEARVIRITKIFLIAGIIGLIISYVGMGFMPIFAAQPISAKFFRDQYQAPYLRVAVLFRSSFYLLSTIIPIACIIWYKYRSNFFLFSILAGIGLMAASLQRSGAFGGVVFAFIIIMSFKSRLHFFILMLILVGVFIFSSFFYYIIGIKKFEDNDREQNAWEVIAAGSPDIQDQLDFMVKFEEGPVWTYGRTMYGGLIPGHYKWNPSVYTLSIIAPGRDVNEVGSGGLRLPLALWGYVSFQWVGVILFSLITGILGGVFLGILKTWIKKYNSILIRATAIIAFSAVCNPIIGFTLMNMFYIPPAIIMLVYLYRIRMR